MAKFFFAGGLLYNHTMMEPDSLSTVNVEYRFGSSYGQPADIGKQGGGTACGGGGNSGEARWG